MDRIITDNSKVNENLLNEVNAVNKQNKELIVKNMDLQEQLLIQRVSNRRELLIDAISNMTRGDFELRSTSEYVDEYLESINCG